MRQKSKIKKKFILHFGPPYANGHAHIGHAFKLYPKGYCHKTYQMMGFEAPLVPYWDCHGLPIEWKIEESYRAKGLSKDDIPILDFLKECRSFAVKWIDIQKTEYERLGIVADWKDHPYLTMEPANEAQIVKQLFAIFDERLVISWF